MKRGNLIIVFLGILILLIVPTISAGFFSDFWDDVKGAITGRVPSSTTSLNITIGNAIPTIIIVEFNSSQYPSEGGTRTITINFTARDTDGFANFNDGSAQARLQKAGEATRSNTSCVLLDDFDTNYANYTCTMDMWYFDGSSSWTVNATIKDNSDAMAENSSQSLTYNLLTSMIMNPTALEWGASVGLSDIDTGSSNDPIEVNNTGNGEDLNINVTSYDLQGEVTTSQYIYANNFTVENKTEGCSGTVMSNATSVNVTSTILQKGNYTLDFKNETSGQEQVFFCLKGVPSDISAQSYSSAALGAWTVEIIT